MNEKKEDTLVEKNRKAFEQYQPAFWKNIKDIEQTITTISRKEGVPVNIDLDGTMLYEDPAPEWTENQLEKYKMTPDRMVFPNASHCNISTISKPLVDHIWARLQEQSDDKQLPAPASDVAYSFILGVGLGYHIEDIFDNFISRHIVIVEPIPEFILHSMEVVDWERIFKSAEENNRKIFFTTGEVPNEIVRLIEGFVHRMGFTFIDGSYIYPHYYSWNLLETFKQLNERLRQVFLSSGYYEDEMIMQENTYQNFKRYAFSLIERKNYVQQDVPVFLVGAGPSIDRDIEYIRKWRDKAIVVSCGTGLRVLLRNEIRPDFHVENENGQNSLDVLRNLRQDLEVDFTGITLIASTTVHPEMGELFDHHWLYFRGNLSTAWMMMGDAKALHGVDPLVSNAGFGVMSLAGFRNIYLFGVDCGKREGSDHHSKSSYYYETDHKEHKKLFDDRFDRVVPGNFGGKIMSGWTWDLSRRMISEGIRALRIKVFNCSDGARIDGAIPKMASAIDLSASNLDPHRAISNVENHSAKFSRADFLERFDLNKHIEALNNFKTDFPIFMDKARELDESYWGTEQSVEHLWQKYGGEFSGIRRFIGGSERSMLRIGAFFGSRIENEDDRREMWLEFLELYQEYCFKMLDHAIEFLTTMNDDVEKTLAEVNSEIKVDVG